MQSSGQRFKPSGNLQLVSRVSLNLHAPKTVTGIKTLSTIKDNDCLVRSSHNVRLHWPEQRRYPSPVDALQFGLTLHPPLRFVRYLDYASHRQPPTRTRICMDASSLTIITPLCSLLSIVHDGCQCDYTVAYPFDRGHREEQKGTWKRSSEKISLESGGLHSLSP
ncbi:hypothetical protein NEOLEDRAFT_276985 [Neolentinus lepideus HHB14362 ss-1]|uniref:Uncharacterized protein n=1 Tax=Neolentinus lepideus HHB14362 ss-1 TaxID=1314782 RepID=A0A165SXL8_9AGAM|nr:hypothetical protein NEOLEDRAFT_276985 [Neolentinus lepideus HHB14362 ss-1]